MALSHSYVRGLQDAVNDNLDLLPSELRRNAATPVSLRQPKIEVELPTLSTTLEADSGILWARMKHPERACCTRELVAETRSYQLYLNEQCGHLSPAEMPFKYLVWTSAAKGAFSLGGDLGFFTHCVREGNEKALTEYAHRCIDVLHDNYNAMELPILTAALVTGDAIGGGLESMITNDIVVAEKGTKFGLPEVLFNMFPGMGAYSYLVRKIGERQARAFIEDGRSRSAEEMVELGLVDVLAEPGAGEAALRDYLGQGKRFSTLRTMRRACKRVDPIAKQELIDIVDSWVDLAMLLSDDDLRRMDCLARVQERSRAKP